MKKEFPDGRHGVRDRENCQIPCHFQTLFPWTQMLLNLFFLENRFSVLPLILFVKTYKCTTWFTTDRYLAPNQSDKTVPRPTQLLRFKYKTFLSTWQTYLGDVIYP